MEIQKIFSEIDTDEKLYSVLMNEDEVMLFSEYQKEFARKDYEGLSREAAEELKRRRSEYARGLMNKYRKSMKDIDTFAINNPNANYIYTSGQIRAGGVNTSFGAETIKDGDSFNNFIRSHKKGTTESLLKSSSKAKGLMRNDALALSGKPGETFVPDYKRVEVPKETGKNLVKEGEQLSKKGLKLGKGGKWAIGITAAAGLGYGAKKLYDRNKEKEN